MTISDRVFEGLREIHMTQKEFSEATGIAPSTISEWKTAELFKSAARFESKRFMKNSYSVDVLVAPENSSIWNWFLSSPYFDSIGQRKK